jgi:lipopolysaccharide export system protein LptA
MPFPPSIPTPAPALVQPAPDRNTLGFHSSLLIAQASPEANSSSTPNATVPTTGAATLEAATPLEPSPSASAAQLGPPLSATGSPSDLSATGSLGRFVQPASIPALTRSTDATEVAFDQPIVAPSIATPPAATAQKLTHSTELASSHPFNPLPKQSQAPSPQATPPARALPSGLPFGDRSLLITQTITQVSAAPTLTAQASDTGEKSPLPKIEPLETRSQRQEYDTINQVFTAVGDVLMQFRQAQLRADRVQTDVANQILVAEGNVILTRGQQILKGERLEYNLILNRGTLFKANGLINVPKSGRDFDANSPVPGASQIQPVTEVLPPGQSLPPIAVTSATPAVNRLRFEADRLDFDGNQWDATNIRITNDPFSPPELEYRADRAHLERISEDEDRITSRRGRIVFDQKVAIPVLQRVTISRRRREILPFQVGYDRKQRGGVYVAKSFTLISDKRTELTLTPEIFLQRAIEQGFSVTDPSVYGGILRIRSQLARRTTLTGFAQLLTLNPEEFEDKTRASLRIQQIIGKGYRLSAEASYRDRLFNGSLGNQNVRSSLGGVLQSPVIPLGKSGFVLSYQVGGQYITADTDRADLTTLKPGEFKGLVSLGRFQGSVTLNRAFVLWQGKPLPPTEEGGGIRYTPTPIQPNIILVAGLAGISSGYTSGDTQNALVGSVSIEGKVGNFSRNWLDYTGFKVSFAQIGNIGTSPFLFDRIADFKVVSLSVLQQLYGPVRVGLQTTINVDTGDQFNTNIIVDYSRRTYGVTFRFSPDRGLGAVLFRINGFNWEGNADPFSEQDIGAVEGGVIRRQDP